MEKTTRRLRKAQATIGLDLGDKRHTFCVLDTRGEVVNKGSMRNERNELAKLASAYPGALVVMEAGMHSPWTSRFLDSLGMEVVVANPRKTRTISQSERKSDERDALVLAPLGRADRNLLSPIVHGSEETQRDLLQIKLRDSLVRARVALINSVRFTLKSLGYRVSNPSSERFHKLVVEELPESVRALIAHSVASIAELTARIKALEISADHLSSADQRGGTNHIALFRAQDEKPNASREPEILEPLWVCVLNEIKAEKPTKSCASANAETAICVACW